MWGTGKPALKLEALVKIKNYGECLITSIKLSNYQTKNKIPDENTKVKVNTANIYLQFSQSKYMKIQIFKTCFKSFNINSNLVLNQV